MVEELSFEKKDVTKCCRTLEVSRSGYYAWLVRPLHLKFLVHGLRDFLLVFFLPLLRDVWVFQGFHDQSLFFQYRERDRPGSEPTPI